jgi:hypothetical protein
MAGAVPFQNGTPRPKATAAGGELPVVLGRPIVPVAALASVPPLPLLRRRAAVIPARAEASVAPVSGLRRKPAPVQPVARRRELATPSLAGKRLLLAGMGMLVLCVQVGAIRLVRSNGADFWPALARATAVLVRAER